MHDDRGALARTASATHATGTLARTASATHATGALTRTPGAPTHTTGALARTSIAAHLTRGAIGFGLLGSAFILVPSVGPAALLLAAPGMVALRGCPTCWLVGLLQTVSAGRLQRSCGATGCTLHSTEAAVTRTEAEADQDAAGSAHWSRHAAAKARRARPSRARQALMRDTGEVDTGGAAQTRLVSRR